MATKPTGVYLGRQPILDRQQNVVAYELLFRSGLTSEAGVTDDTRATAQVMNALHKIGIRTVLGKATGFVNVDAATLMSKTVESFPKELVVIELLESIDIDASVVHRCRELKGKGYRLALDDVSRFEDGYPALLPFIDVVKIDVLMLDQGALAELVRQLRLSRVKLLAEKVETRDRVNQCLGLGFRLFQGFFFGHPAVLAA